MRRIRRGREELEVKDMVGSIELRLMVNIAC